MTFSAERLFELLPAIYRLRDLELAGRTPGTLSNAEAAELRQLEAGPGSLVPAARRRLAELQSRRDRGPLAAFLTLLADQIAVLEENLDQLYDDQFVETAAGWALSYIGDLIGYRELHQNGPGLDRRAEIAHTIAFRRRKGAASMLEQLARDVTGFNARAVEYFDRLATTQSMNHRRLHNRVTPSLRAGRALEWMGGAFDEIPHTLDVRRIQTGGGRYNIPNVGIFLWRLDALRLGGTPATPDPTDVTGRRFRFSPLGIDQPLVGRPVREEEISHLAEPINVPAPLTRRRLQGAFADFYGAERSVHIERDTNPVPGADVVVCALPDAAGGWAHDAPPGKVAVDPMLGRLVVAADLPAPASLAVMFHRAGVRDCFGGEYVRSPATAVAGPAAATVPGTHTSIQDALDSLGGSGVVEITDSGRYAEALAVTVAPGGSIVLRAADGRSPTLDLPSPLVITGGDGSRAHLDGLLVLGDAIEVPAAGNTLGDLTIAHCTLVPGIRLGADGTPSAPGTPSVAVAARNVSISISRSISGPLRVPETSVATLTDSIIDASLPGEEAFGSGGNPGGRITVESSTIVGRVRATSISASNSIMLGRVEVVRRQEGCLRFSYAPVDSLVPRRHRCQPSDDTAAVDVPHFASLRFGAGHYGRLAGSTPESIRRGAEDESEMGAFRWRHEPQRMADLLTRFDEYLRVGLSAGVFHES